MSIPGALAPTEIVSAYNNGGDFYAILGIDINEEKVREMAKIGHDWKNPVWRLPDGSPTEW